MQLYLCLNITYSGWILVPWVIKAITIIFPSVLWSRRPRINIRAIILAIRQECITKIDSLPEWTIRTLMSWNLEPSFLKWRIKSETVLE
jgi:hypothetical protein